MKSCRYGYDSIQKKDLYKIQYTAKDIPARQLFNSDDVIIGNPSSNIAIGFVYTWKEDRPPLPIREFFQRVSNYAYITGLWKTTNGARYVFANILGNPNVNKLILFVFDHKDNGHLLVNAVVNFWKNGVDKDGIIVGCRAPNPRFEQVPGDALDRVRKQADLVVMRFVKDLDRAEKLIRLMFQEPENASSVPSDAEFYSTIGLKQLYDDGARFDKPYLLDLSAGAKSVSFIQKYSELPLGQTVHADNLQDALEMITAFVYKNGEMLKDQRGVITMESRSFAVTIRDPLEIIPHGFSDSYIKKYVAEFMEGVGGSLDEFAYTYHERLFKHWGNQVERAVKVLKKNPNTRRCMLSLWDPSSDLEQSNPPCLDFIWLVVRDKKLEMHVVYRSHHLATITKNGRLMEGEGAFVPNLYALGTLHKQISEKINHERGPIVLTDFSGHLYMSNV